MQCASYSLEGQLASDLPPKLRDALKPSTSYGGDGFDVLLVEKQEFWRTNSNMQVTVILDRTSETSYDVEVCVGGGAGGLLNLTFGSEKKILGKIRPKLERAFDDLALEARDAEGSVDERPDHEQVDGEWRR